MIMRPHSFSGCDRTDVVGRKAEENCSVRGDHGAERQEVDRASYTPKGMLLKSHLLN